MRSPAIPLFVGLTLLSSAAAGASELRPLALDAQALLGVSPAAPPAALTSDAEAPRPALPVAYQAPARPATVIAQTTLSPAAALPTEVAPVIAAASAPATARRLYEVKSGEMASDVFTRWLREDGVQLIWQTSRDFRLEAGARFHEEAAIDAVRAVADVLGRTHPDFIVRAFSNGVVVVMDRT